MPITLKNIVVFVSDFDKAKKFYKEQLQLPAGQESPAMLEFFPGTVSLGVARAMTEEALRLVGRHTGITLTVTGIDRLCRDLEQQGVRFAEPLAQSPWGKMAVVMDPDGNQFALVEG
ncbi:MAG TPA: VOC family protein [Geobacterales bacterium]|nr:VOC family protein [Geobacterales bacterium]